MNFDVALLYIVPKVYSMIRVEFESQLNPKWMRLKMEAFWTELI